jgi:hypothetical protein
VDFADDSNRGLKTPFADEAPRANNVGNNVNSQHGGVSKVGNGLGESFCNKSSLLNGYATD